MQHCLKNINSYLVLSYPRLNVITFSTKIWSSTTVLYHRLTRRCVKSYERFGNAHCVTDVWSPYRITPIHWLMARRRHWRNHIVSLYCERAIHSSDFSAFTKRSNCPSLLRFSGPIIYSTRFYPFALRRLPQWNFVLLAVKRSIAAVNRRARDSSLAKTHTVSALSVWGFRMHAMRFMGSQNANFAKTSVS